MKKKKERKIIVRKIKKKTWRLIDKKKRLYNKINYKQALQSKDKNNLTYNKD